MNELQWYVVKHADLSKHTRNSIAELKNQHWNYGIESQLEWMSRYIQNNDYHLLGVDNIGFLKAYLTISQIRICCDGRMESALGLGCVCVDKEIKHSGFGKKILFKANDFIIENNKRGFLLCKESIVEFYQKCKWINVDYDNILVDGRVYNDKVMTYPGKFNGKKLIIDRNF